MEEIGAQATKAARRHQNFRCRDVGWVAWAHALALGDRERAGAFEEARDPPGLYVELSDFGNENGLFAVKVSRKR